MKANRLIINGLLIFSVVIISWINVFEVYYIPVLLNVDAFKINRLLETISIAYLTSFIFYFVVVRLKEKQDKQIIYPFIADYIYVAMNICIQFAFSMRNSAGLDSIKVETSINNRNKDIYPNQVELKTICSTINPNDEKSEDIGIDGLKTIPHFFGIMINYTYRIDYFLKIVLEKSNFMDTELLRIITDIQTHGYHQHMLTYEKNMVLTARHRHDNLNVFEKSFSSYFDLFRKLEDYADKNLKVYVERESFKKK